MNTLTVKINDSLEQAINKASAQAHVSKSELVRRAIQVYISRAKTQVVEESALQQAGDLVGCFQGGPDDLSCNPDHLADFGRV